MTTMLRILIIHDSQEEADPLIREFRRGGFDPRWERVETAEALTLALASERWDIVVADFDVPLLPGFTGLELVRKTKPALPFIFISGKIGEEMAVEAIKAGADDFLLKENLDRFVPAVKRVLQESEAHFIGEGRFSLNYAMKDILTWRGRFAQRRLFVFLFDCIFIGVAYSCAFLFRYGFHIDIFYQDLFLHSFLVAVLVKPLAFLFSNLYRSLWRYASFHDAVEIFKTVSLASIVLVLGLLFSRQFDHFPRSILILDWLVLLFMLASSRLAWRFYRETHLFHRSFSGQRTLIVGAGEAGSMLLKEIHKQPKSAYNVVGFVDDNPDKHGMRLHGVPVLGDTLQLSRLVRTYRAEKVIIALPSHSGKAVRTIVQRCQMVGVRFKTLPGLVDIINGKVSISQIKDVEIEDLLGREPVLLDEAGIRGYLTDKRVMVTGAGGSIGSEICRQLAQLAPRKILLLDSAETALHYIEQELVNRYPGLTVLPILGDIRDARKVDAVFEEFKPEVVFHAAAYKHVPMMEFNPGEAVTNNIGGTRILADAAHRFGVTDFVMISTDKAVNPTNVMGASKRAAELYVQSLAGQSNTRFSTVRFGNVLGSNGSVIPMFKEQIRNGGPVTVTDPKVIRYFMTIPEATQLVLQAGCIGTGSDIFVLDMGEPVSILELAEQLIRLSGFVPHDDIEIAFTGLRPGEKLFEELLIEGEGIKPTVHEKIKVLLPTTLDYERVVNNLEQLAAAADKFDLVELIRLLRQLVPEYTPAYHFSDTPPKAFRLLRPDLFEKTL